ncbi:MAG: 6-hydroxymethylpterin diphosphokinase MptE-like protein [Phycisphaeraceae bacterium]
MAALTTREPELAQRVLAAVPAALEWQEARSGVLTATIEQGGRPLWLASRFDPVQEAGKLAAEVDHEASACVVVLGMGLGYHVAEVARQAGGHGLVIVHEPDVALMRAVLERVDHSAWLGRPDVIVVDATVDRAGLTQRVERFAGVLTQGTRLLTHPPSRRLHGEALAAFGQTVTQTLAFCRTNVATALINSARTCRNLACNLDHYLAGAGVDELHNAAAGSPAVCVAAGPSLAKNVDLLRDPRVRANVVVITAQTTLKPLLDRGIRPDFVTALDYSRICERFYENLPELADVTLVAEPKAHPTILESFPGPIRLLRNAFSDGVVAGLAPRGMKMPAATTVAHLSFYLAQHLGCDPIMLIGQDLGFSDGLYYCPGTAAHQVWSAELGPFNTLEMMEWERIVRHRNHLRRVEGVDGTPIYTDEQMATYQGQFERDFAQARQRIIDATEGGVVKAGAEVMPLAEALAQFATQPVPALPLPGRELDADRLEALVGRLEARRREIDDLKRTSKRCVPLLEGMLRHQRDQKRVYRLYQELQAHQRRVGAALDAAFQLVSSLNTIGAMKRARADRAIAHAGSDEMARQRRQLERDIENMDWLIQACDVALDIFEEALGRARASRSRCSAVAAPGPPVPA